VNATSLAQPNSAAPSATPATTAAAVASSAPAPATPADEHRAAISRIEAQAARATPESARAIGQTILRGAAPDVVATALDALAALGRPEGAPAVAHSLRHRRALIRRHAIAAARAIHTPDLVDALGDLLGDPVAAVRLDAAMALSEVGNRAVGARVLEAFERDLDDAQGPDGGPLTRPCALAIGKFGSSDDVRHLLGFLGRAPLRAITDAMREAVRRPALAEALRVQIVTAIGRLATRDARVFLETVIADAGGQDNALVRAARESASRIGE
jgi:HEAT repeat protein